MLIKNKKLATSYYYSSGSKRCDEKDKYFFNNKKIKTINIGTKKLS